ncbi:MAG: hypothetical protein RJB38_592 [Pseudomonadota bacterium]
MGKLRNQNRFNHVLVAIDVQRSFQGLTLDQTGIGTLLVAIQERETRMPVGRIKVQSKLAKREQVFDQSFTRRPNLFVSLPFFSRIISQSDSVKAEIEIKYHLVWLISQGLINILMASLLVGIQILYSKMRAQQAELEKSRLIKKISAQVAHDIRAPIAALKVALAYSEELSSEVREIATMAISRTQAIAKDLLDLTHPIHSKQATSHQECFILEEAINGVIQEKKLILATESPGVFLQYSSNSNTQGLYLSGSKKEFQRMLSNLINNALEAVESAGSIDLKLAVESDSIVISLKDTGPGIPEAVLKRLGERGNTLSKPSGTGLGLAHAIETTKKLGGNLRVSTPESGGTVVQIELPSRSPASRVPTKSGNLSFELLQ